MTRPRAYKSERDDMEKEVRWILRRVPEYVLRDLKLDDAVYNVSDRELKLKWYDIKQRRSQRTY
jgi:hypothetical protein